MRRRGIRPTTNLARFGPVAQRRQEHQIQPFPHFLRHDLLQGAKILCRGVGRGKRGPRRVPVFGPRNQGRSRRARTRWRRPPGESPVPGVRDGDAMTDGGGSQLFAMQNGGHDFRFPGRRNRSVRPNPATNSQWRRISSLRSGREALPRGQRNQTWGETGGIKQGKLRRGRKLGRVHFGRGSWRVVRAGRTSPPRIRGHERSVASRGERSGDGIGRDWPLSLLYYSPSAPGCDPKKELVFPAEFPKFSEIAKASSMAASRQRRRAELRAFPFDALEDPGRDR